LAALATCAGLLSVGSSATSASAETPTLGVGCSPAPTDCTGWYRESVTVKWDWSIGQAVYFAGDCLPNPDPWVTFSADTAGLESWCEIKDVDSSDRALRTVVLHIDKTAPSVAGVTARPSDYGGWFNHPVSVSFHGSDATSGVASCSSATYAGPDAAGAVISGTCQDVAGNVGTGSLALNYDATPPPPPSVDAMPGNHRVRITWTTSLGASSEVVRFSRNQPPALVYQGTGDAITDRSLVNGRRYRYVVTQIDQAGNRSAGQAIMVPTASRLLLPWAGQRIKLTQERAFPPVLVWKRVRRADYYNAQVFRDGRKILSVWPAQPRRKLERRWTYQGRRYELSAGRYCWIVWPGHGKRSDRQYGKRLGPSCFYVVR
jgi:hypothetical protein